MNLEQILNPMQQKAVEHTEGPLLILAGAGSGKTRVLTHRIAWLIEEKGVAPWNILAITFTNKAAGEMRERVDQLVGYGADQIWVSTFHACCVRILRRYADRIGYDNNFTIYDSEDQKSVIKEVMRMLDLDPKMYKDRAILSAISSAKNEMISPDAYEKNAGTDWKLKKYAACYHAYQEQLKKSNAMDFDDLLAETVHLFEECPEILENYQERFRYIMVDEYQDTNTVQFRMISLLAAKYRNLCVVGDDDQSIYRFRGANIKNILSFEYIFQDAEVIKLEQNYRSTKNILNAANGVIAHNTGRKEKSLWTDNAEGRKLGLHQFNTGFDEAEYVAGEITRRVRTGQNQYRDFAVLYRTNAQSRLFEEKFLMANLPYKLVGGVNFYARKEIKDLLAYLRVIDNPVDDVAVQRIINVPRRGIGASTITKVALWAEEQGISFFDALLEAEYIPGIGRALAKLKRFTTLIQVYQAQAPEYSVRTLLEHLDEEIGYTAELKAEDTEEAKGRLENIDELISKMEEYEEAASEPTLSGFLSEVALVSDLDTVDEDSDYCLLMTLHGAKGLEFKHVFLVGMEDGIFPSYMTITGDDPEELEEERRLCYVGITRAMEELDLSAARQRMVRGEVQYNKLSRFVKEVPRELFELEAGSDFNQRRRTEGPSFGLRFDSGTPSSFGSSYDSSYGSSRFSSSNSERTSRTASYGSKPSYGSLDTAFDWGSRSLGEEGSERGYTRASLRGQSPARAYGAASQKSQASSPAPGKPDYGIGDTVKHVKFGVGIVREITEGGRDYEVTVDFDQYGVKRMFASFAKLKKL